MNAFSPSVIGSVLARLDRLEADIAALKADRRPLPHVRHSTVSLELALARLGRAIAARDARLGWLERIKRLLAKSDIPRERS